MGPFELMDLTGIDVNFLPLDSIYEGFQKDPRLKTTYCTRRCTNPADLDAKPAAGFTTIRTSSARLRAASQQITRPARSPSR